MNKGTFAVKRRFPHSRAHFHAGFSLSSVAIDSSASNRFLDVASAKPLISAPRFSFLFTRCVVELPGPVGPILQTHLVRFSKRCAPAPSCLGPPFLRRDRAAASPCIVHRTNQPTSTLSKTPDPFRQGWRKAMRFRRNAPAVTSRAQASPAGSAHRLMSACPLSLSPPWVAQEETTHDRKKTKTSISIRRAHASQSQARSTHPSEAP